MMRRDQSRPEWTAAFRVQRFHTALGKVVPIILKNSRYLEPGSYAVKRKTAGVGSGMGQPVEKLRDSRFRRPLAVETWMISRMNLSQI
jgi:hypothetical protein